MFMIKDLKVTNGTIARAVLTILAVVNFILKSRGINVIDVDEDSIYAVVENFVSAGAILWGFWKNNSFTLAARNADFALAKYKAGIVDDEVDYSEGE